MEIILNKTVEKLGQRGSILHVADGYARNYLIPKGLAMPVTPGARKQAEAMQRAEERREQHRRDAAGEERAVLHGRAVTVRARATAEGKLYGSVGAKEICDALRETHGIGAKQDMVQLEHGLREVGTHEVVFRIYHDIDAVVSVTVKGVEDDAPAATTAASAAAAAEAEAHRAPRPKPIITEGAEES